VNNHRARVGQGGCFLSLTSVQNMYVWGGFNMGFLTTGISDRSFDFSWVTRLLQ
jgi:hypothetical protein